MTNELSRREAIARATGVAAAIAGRQALAQSSHLNTPVPSWKTELRQLAPNIFGYVQAGGPGIPGRGVSNAGVVVGDDHMLVVDSLGAPLHTKAFIAAVQRAVPEKPFGRMVVTHHHGDHIWGLPYFVPIEIVSHEYCRQAMLATAVPSNVWEKREGWAEGGEERKIIPPTMTFNDKTTYYYGKTTVQVMFSGPAHTWGDVMVYLPDYKILFAGDVAFHYVAPFCHNAHVTKWIEAVDRIMKMDVDIIVPGHGPIGGKKELSEMRSYLEVFKREARKRYDAGLTPGQAAADISLGPFDSWVGASDRMAMNAVRLYHEFDGTLVPDADVKGMEKADAEYAAIRSKR